MRNTSPLYKSVATAVCIALCIVLPFAFHSIPNGGTLFSPMHLPVLLCGIIYGPQYGAICGLMGPLLSGILTGMPGMGYLPAMMIELCIYGLISGLMMQISHSSNLFTNLYTSLLCAMLSGRIITGILQAMIFMPDTYTIKAWIMGYFISCFPAIAMQLLLIPILYIALKKAGLVPHKKSAVPQKD